MSSELPLPPTSVALLRVAELPVMVPVVAMPPAVNDTLPEPALIEALQAGRLAGAVLDVFSEEPLPPDDPMWDAPNVILTPHVSGATQQFLDDLVIENVRRYLAGERLLNIVDPGRGY
jgi:phosphoglycerate dehydrogenase-like enzyme